MSLEIDLREIIQTLELSDGSRLVLLDRAGKKDKYTQEDRARNIYRVSGDGAVMWQVRSRFDTDGGPFTKMLYEDNVLTAYRWDGGLYAIDILTGEATPKAFMK